MLLISCSEHEEIYTSDISPGSYSIQKESYQRSFAKTLSKAVYRNSNLRKFIREEALRQFDNDYDVFYPLLKNEIVSGDSTFRDILLSYADDEELFIQMETEMPMLNILVPDWSWITGFSAESWDISDPEVAVSYADDNDSHIIFGDGEEIGDFKNGEYPGLPVLVVKNNERLRKNSGNGDSKSFLGEYEFIDEAFDGLYRPQKRVASQYYDINIPTEETNNFVPASELDPLVIGAYNEFKDIDTAIQRDYIYYGKTKTQPRGNLRTNVFELLYKMRINPDAYRRLSDQIYDDPHLTNVSHKKSALSTEEILNKIWTEGKYELQISVFWGKDNNTTESVKFTFSIDPKDLFDVSTIHVEYKHGTWFTKAHYIYRVGDSDLKPKWYVFSQHNPNRYLAQWDIFNYSINMAIHVFEIDKEGTETITYSYEMGNAHLMKDEHGNEITINGNSKTTYQITIPSKSEEIGRNLFNFYRPVVLSEQTINGVNGYNMSIMDMGSVDLMVIPTKMR